MFLLCCILLYISNSCNLQTCWDLWWNGNPDEHCAPYRLIRGTDLSPDDKKNKVELAKARKIMEHLIALLRSVSVPIAKIAQDSIQERRRYFGVALIALYKDLYPGKTLEDFDRLRFGHLSYLRVYDLLVEAKRNGSI
jgi:hypothetical protein